MATTDDPTTTAPDFEALADSLAAGLVRNGGITSIWTSAFRPILDLVAGAVGLVLAMVTEIAAFIAKLLVQAMQTAAPEVADLTAATLEEVFGRAFGGAGGGASDPASAAQSIGRGVISALTSNASGSSGGGLEPSTAPAEAFLGGLMEVGVRGWILDLLAETLTLGQLNAFNDLIEIVIGTLGFGRLAHTALQPVIQTLIALPAHELVLEQYRPKRLGEGLAVKQVIRGKWDAGQLDDELGHQGYSADRQEALLNDARKFLALGDVDRLVREGILSAQNFDDDAADQGYLPIDSSLYRQALDLARADAMRNQVLTLALVELRDGIIDQGQFDSLVQSMHVPVDEQVLWSQIATIRLSIPRKSISVAELNTMLTKNIVSLGEYRDRLVALGYSDADATLLELLQQTTLNDKAEAAAAKKQVAAQKAAAATQKAADKAAAAAQKKADAAAAKASAQAFIQAKADAANQAAIAKAQLAAQVIQEHQTAIDDAAKQKLITAEQAAQFRQTAKQTTATHAATVKAAVATTTAADQAKAAALAADVQLKITAEKAAATTSAAKKRASLDQQLLDARSAARVAGFQLTRQNAQDSFDAGEITAAALAKKLRAVDLAEQKEIAAEGVAALQAQKAQDTADNAAAAGALAVDTLTEKQQTLPQAAQARQDAIAAAAAGNLDIIATAGTATTTALASIASAQIQALDVHNATMDQLTATIAQQKLALEQTIIANKPKPPAPPAAAA